MLPTPVHPPGEADHSAEDPGNCTFSISQVPSLHLLHLSGSLTAPSPSLRFPHCHLLHLSGSLTAPSPSLRFPHCTFSISQVPSLHLLHLSGHLLHLSGSLTEPSPSLRVPSQSCYRSQEYQNFRINANEHFYCQTLIFQKVTERMTGKTCSKTTQTHNPDTPVTNMWLQVLLMSAAGFCLFPMTEGSSALLMV